MGLFRWHFLFRIIRRRYLFNTYLLLGSISIVVVTTVFTIRVSQSVERQSILTTQLLSGYASRLFDPEAIEEIGPIIEIVNEIEVPFIMTDNSGRPLMWNEPVIGIPVLDLEILMTEDIRRPNNPVVQEILSLAAAYDDIHQPFAINSPEGQRLGTLHYGRSELSQRLRVMPYLELMVMALFFLVILWALQSKKDAEQQALFAGMAKETAHQMGTPLTSIMGWVALLEEKLPAGDDTMAELNRDIDRLGMVSARFSQIGSQPQLEDTDLMGIVDETIEYFQRRLPHLGGRVNLRREGNFTGRVIFNKDLLGWVLENLIKNGIDALVDGKGTITVAAADTGDGGVELRVSDTGKGIPSRDGNKIFEPGYTTKKRGWGMGLALVQRIVSQYHGGRIRVESSSSHGTTFLLTLPPAPGAGRAS
jgi:signal transduction histidine kinase